MTGRSSLWHNTIVSVGSTALQGLGNLATVIYLARILEPQGYGLFSYTGTIIGMVGVLVYLGLPPLFTRRLSRDSDFSGTIGYGISFLAVISLMVTLMFLLSVQWIPEFHHLSRIFDVWALMLLVNGLNPQWILSGLQQLWIAGTMALFGTMLRLFLTIWLVHGADDLARAVAITVIATATTVLGELLWLRYSTHFHMVWIAPHEIWSTIRMALPLAVTSFASILYSGVDSWLLHIFVGSKAVGIYAAAWRPVVFLTTFSGVYFNLTYPILSRLTIHDHALAQRVVQLLEVSVFAIVLPLGVGSGIIAEPLMRQVFGTAYDASGPVLAVLIWSWVFGILRETFSTTLISGNGEVAFAKAFAMTACVNACLMLYCVRWGPVGTASALVITQGILLILCVLAVRRVVAHPLAWSSQGRYAVKIILNTAVMGLAVWWVHPYVPVELAIAVGIILYGSLTWASGAVPWQEILSTLRTGQPDSNPD